MVLALGMLVPTIRAEKDLSSVATGGPVVKRSSSAIAMTIDGSTLIVVNPDSDSLSLVDTNSREVVAELAVGVDPRTVAVADSGTRAYVANVYSDSVSVIDITVSPPVVVYTVTAVTYPGGVAITPDGNRPGLLIVHPSGMVRFVIKSVNSYHS